MSGILEHWRKKIDAIDKKIIILLGQRSAIVKKICQWKKTNNIPALDKKRWPEVLQTRIKIARNLDLEKDFIEEIYEIIHKNSLKIEKQL